MGLADFRHRNLVGERLHAPGYVQADDPGAVGGGKLWFDTASNTQKVRNAADDGWVVIGASGSGTSFPDSPVAGQRFYRTDRLSEYIWDGTYWVSELHFAQASQMGGSQPFGSTGWALNWMLASLRDDYPASEVWVERIVLYTVLDGSTLNGSNKWDIGVYTAEDGYSSSIFDVVLDDNTDPAFEAFNNTWVQIVNARWTYGRPWIWIEKTGSPSGLWLAGTLAYRVIA